MTTKRTKSICTSTRGPDWICGFCGDPIPDAWIKSPARSIVTGTRYDNARFEFKGRMVCIDCYLELAHDIISPFVARHSCGNHHVGRPDADSPARENAVRALEDNRD